MDKSSLYTHRVRYSEVDKMGVVYHSRYIEWFEAARTEMLREKGLPYRQLENDGIMLPVIEVVCRYHSPVRYDDLVFISTTITKLNRIRLELAYTLRIENHDALCVSGLSVHCFVNAEGKPVRADKSLVEFIKKSSLIKEE